MRNPNAAKTTATGIPIPKPISSEFVDTGFSQAALLLFLHTSLDDSDEPRLEDVALLTRWSVGEGAMKGSGYWWDLLANGSHWGQDVGSVYHKFRQTVGKWSE